jgi:hypothetical protein
MSTLAATASPAICEPQEKEYPRRRRVGGLAMNQETVLAWGSRILGRQLGDSECDTANATMAISRKVKPYRAKFLPVGEVYGIEWMIPTQIARFDGYKDMDPSLIPPFEEGNQEALARKLLMAEGW